ncbi:MAG: penicillin-binding protein, partial [Candidatus Dadabacteria bacterium]
MMRRLVRVGFIGAVLAVLVGAAVLAWFNSQLPRIDSLKNYEPALITQVWDRHGRLLTEFASQRRIIVPLNKMPKHLRDAFIAAEDDQFYEHFGIDPLGILRAAWKMVVAGRIRQGASTITQQVARSFFLTQQRKFSRKIKEILLALKLERNLTK